MKLKEVEVWGPWVEHDGTCLPVKPGTYVGVKYSDGSSAEFRAMHRKVFTNQGCRVVDYDKPLTNSKKVRWLWDTLPENSPGRIVSYRVRKTALQMLKECLNVVQEPVVSPISV